MRLCKLTIMDECEVIQEEYKRRINCKNPILRDKDAVFKASCGHAGCLLPHEDNQNPVLAKYRLE